MYSVSIYTRSCFENKNYSNENHARRGCNQIFGYLGPLTMGCLLFSWKRIKHIYIYIHISIRRSTALNGTQAWSWAPSTTFCPTPRSSAAVVNERWWLMWDENLDENLRKTIGKQWKNGKTLGKPIGKPMRISRRLPSKSIVGPWKWPFVSWN